MYMSNTSSAIENTANAISDFTSAAGEQTENLQKILNLIDKLPDGLTDLTNSFDNLSDGINSIAELSAALNDLQAVLTLVSQASSGFSSIMSMMKSPVTAVIAVLAILYATNEEFRNSMNALLGQIIESLQPVIGTLITLLGTVIDVAAQLLDGIAGALIPVLDTLTPMIGMLLDAFVPVVNIMLQCINDILPVLAEAIVPIITLLGELISQHLQVLMPILEVLANILAVGIGQAVQRFFDTFSTVLIPILDAVASALQFLCQLFTGDFKAAAESFKNFFISIGNAILGVIASLVQRVVDAVAAIVNFFIDMINGVIKIVNKLPFVNIKLIGHVDWSDATSNWKIPAMAAGGIITAPTYALVGEGRYPEAVLPLGDSPQFAEMKAEIARAVVQGLAFAGQYDANKPIEVVVNIDSREIARATERGKRLNSANRIANVGGVL